MRARGRSALIVALIAIPVAGMAALVLVTASATPTPSEYLRVELGSTQASVQVVAPPATGLVQDPRSTAWGYSGSASESVAQPTKRVADLIPLGTRILPLLTSAATVRTPDGIAAVTTVLGRSWDPAFDGRYRLAEGRAPDAAGEILASVGALKRLGVPLGGTTHVIAPGDRDVTVVGILDARSSAASEVTLFGMPESFGAHRDIGADPQSVVYLPDTRLSWTQVKALNAEGAVALSRVVALDPPPSPEYDSTGLGDRSNPGPVLTGSLIVGFALLEVILLAGAAFMVGARAQERSLATLASVGGPRGELIGVITSSGLLLGACGGVIGVIAGVGLGTLFMAASDDGSATRYWGYHLPVGLMLLIGLAAVVVGWLGALVPAIRASRLDVVQALRGARRPPVQNLRRPLFGLVLLLAGIAVTLAGGVLLAAITTANRGTSEPMTWALTAMMIGGPILVIFGLVLCARLLLSGVARALGGVGVAARLAARDAARNPARSIPAVAVILTTVFVAVFAMTMAASGEATATSQYQYRLLPGQVGVPASTIDSDGRYQAADAQAIAGAMQSTLHGARVGVLSSVSDPATLTAAAASDGRALDPDALLPSLTIPAQNQCPSEQTSVNYDERTSERGSAEANAAASDWRCHDPYVLWGGMWGDAGHIWVGDAADLALMLGRSPSTAERTVLSDGGAVSFYPQYVQDGSVNISWWPARHWDNARPLDASAPVARSRDLHGISVRPAHPLPYGILVSPQTADSLGLRHSPSVVVATPRVPTTQADVDALNGRISAITGVPDSYATYVEAGPPRTASGFAWALVALSAIVAIAAASVAIGLARADGRRDQVTLAAVGASPFVRRGFGFWQAIVLAGLGAVLGTLTGLIPAIALTLPGASTQFSAPWLQILVAVAGLPLAIAAVSWLTARRVAIDVRRSAIV